MPDLGQWFMVPGMLILSGAYLWLLWQVSKDWEIRAVLALFPILPTALQTIMLGAVLLWAIREEQKARAAAVERQRELEKKVLHWGPREV